MFTSTSWRRRHRQDVLVNAKRHKTPTAFYATATIEGWEMFCQNISQPFNSHDRALAIRHWKSLFLSRETQVSED